MLSGVEECDDEIVVDVVKKMIPEVEVIEALRVGKPPTTATTTDSNGTTGRRPRRIVVKLSESGKARVWQNRHTLQFADQNVFVNHDLTRREQEARRQVVPTYKQLRTKGVWCSLPRGPDVHPPERKAHDRAGHPGGSLDSNHLRFSGIPTSCTCMSVLPK